MDIKKIALPSIVASVAAGFSAQSFAIAVPLTDLAVTDQLTQITTDLGVVGLAMVGVAAVFAGFGWIMARL